MSILKQSQQREISLQRALPITNTGNASEVKTASAETVQLYYYNNGVQAADAGQAAGTLVVGKLSYDNVLSKLGDVIGGYLNSSLSFANANTFDAEVSFPFWAAELKDGDSGLNKLEKIAEVLTTNGQYCVDYSTGTIYGKKKNTGTTVAATYKYPSSVAVISGGDIQIGAVELKDGSTDNRGEISSSGNLSTLSKGTYNATEPTLSDGDESSLQLNESGELKVTGGAGASSVSAEYISPSDFTATYTSASTITLSGVPVTITDSSQIAYIKQVKTDNTSNTFVNGANDITLSYSANVITVYEKGVAITSLASGDVYEIGVNGTKKAYDLSIDADKIINLTPESSKYVQDSLVDTTNVAAATNYYPSSTGMSMDGYKDFSLSGKFIDADGTMTLSIEATNDEDTTNADWIDISLLGIDSKTGINVITAAMTVTNGTLTFGIEYNDLNYSNIRVKMVNGGATNTAIIKARRKAL